MVLVTLAITTWWLGKGLIYHRIRNPKYSRLLVSLGVLINLATLAWFKYSNFFVQNWDNLTGQHHRLQQLILPLGISFFVFQKIAYLIDCWKGKVFQTSFTRFALFVSFFPQLIAGPICHHKDITPQLGKFRISPERTAHGLFLLVLGLAKKVLIADNLAIYANSVFDSPQHVQFMDAWTGTLAYTLQLYFDFSAYSEMAMGVALLFGVVLPINFNSPYKSRNIGEFWQRWHITLGRFLKDYLYIPLGGNKKGLIHTILIGILVFTVGGLWHGAGWHFVAWGILHGIYLAFYRLWQHGGKKLPDWMSLGLTLSSVIFAWVLFRAESIPDALHIWSVMFGMQPVILPSGYADISWLANLGSGFAQSAYINGTEIVWLTVLLVGVITWKNVHELWESFQLKPISKYAIAATIFVCTFSLSNPSQYLYWTF